MAVLDLTFADLYTEVAYYLGYGRDSTKWGAVRTAAVKLYVNDGYRHFLMGLDPRTRTAYEWSFLSPAATITIWATASGTMTVSGAGDTTVTDSTNSPFYASMVGHTITSTNASYTITAYTSSSVVTVSADASADTGNAFTITATGKYSLPSDFGAIVSLFAFDENTGSVFLYEEAPVQIRKLIAGSGSTTGTPSHFALQPRAYTTTDGQRWEIHVWRIPSSDFTMYYRYRTHPALMTADAVFPVGGLHHTQTVLQCAIAAAELRERDGEAAQAARRDELLAASIDLDARLKAHIHGSMGAESQPARIRTGVTYTDRMV